MRDQLPSPPSSFSACLILDLPPSPPASFSAALLLCLPPSPPATIVDLFLVRFCAQKHNFIFIWNAFGTTCLSLTLLRFSTLVFSRFLQVCVRSITWQPKTEVCTYVGACVQHNRLRAHMVGLTFKMYCNDNVEDDT